MCKKTFFFLIFSSLFSLWAQDAPVGQFKEYLNYSKFLWVAQDGENVYGATEKSILVVDKNDGSLTKWSKLNGLSEIGIQTIYADQKGRLFIAYTNSNLDIVKDYKVYNIRDILNKQIAGSKTINHIFAIDDLAYLSCDFGVVVLDLKTFLVKDSWFTVRNDATFTARFLTIHNNCFFLATDKGVFSTPVTSSNPSDFSRWNQEEDELAKSSFRLLCSYNGKLFAVKEGKEQDFLFSYNNVNWQQDTSLHPPSCIRSLEIKDDKLLLCSWNHVIVFSGDEYKRYDWGAAWPTPYQNGYYATFDNNMNIWVADFYSGLIRINTKDNTYKVISAEGPANCSAYGLFFADGMLAVVPGARMGAVEPNHSAAPAVSIMKDDSWWTSYWPFIEFPYAKAFNSVIINPLNKNEIYIASWLGGLFKINKENDEIVCYNGTNSPIISGRSDSLIFLSGLAVDKHNHLWMAQSGVTHLVSVKDLNTKEEKWNTFNLVSSGSGVKAEHILIDSRDYKWITIPNQNNLIVLRGGMNNIEKSKYNIDLQSQTNVTTRYVRCIAEDKEGRIWLGTDQGIKVIYDAASVFDRTVYAKNILLEQNGYVQNLLEFENITCIAVDAADRKWIGTSTAGVFFVSPTGTQELLHFTADNSPLFSNQIYDIKINHENGEVFFATAGGLISYKGTATVGKSNFKEVLVYPNPVRENYTGPVAVKGLMEGSFCKITDAAGNLVWHGYAYGGQLIWDGKDFYGKRPATGVYFVMASSKNGKDKKVAKFLFIQ